MASKNIGSSPGTIVIDPDAPKPKIYVICFDEHNLVEEEISDFRRLEELIEKWPTLWVQVVGLGDKATLLRLGELFRLHRLTLEDVTQQLQRPKIEQYGDQFFIVARILETINDFRVTQQISIFLEKKFVLTFQESEVKIFDSLKNRIRTKAGRVRTSGADYLCYAIMDSIIDQYFPALSSITDKLDAIEANVFGSSRTELLRDLHNLRHDLLSMRRAVWPLREVINTMMRESVSPFTDETKLHLRDCYDHTVQIVDLIESYRELSASLMELSYTLLSHKLNDGIRILTVISTIFIPLNFIAGVYGMNFNTQASPWNMPELQWRYGYLAVILVMVVVTVVQMFFFWRRGWLGEQSSSPK